MRVRASWRSGALGVLAVAGVIALVAVLLVARESGGGKTARARSVTASQAGGCDQHGGGPVAPRGGITPKADVTVTGAREIDTRGLTPLVVASGDGATWATVRDPARSTGIQEATVAGVDPAAGAFTTVTQVATGCSASALAVGGGAVWVGTCDELASPDAAAGGQVVRVDPGTGQVTQRVPLPTRCVARLAVGKDAVSVGEAGLAGHHQRVWRIDPADGAVREIESVAGDTSLGGVAVTDGGVWTQQVTPGRNEAMRTDPSTGQAQGTVPENDATLTGGHGDGVWFLRARPPSIAQRDAATGAVRTETPVPNVRSAVVGASGAWFQQATKDSLTVTVGRIDPATGAIGPTFSFEGVGPDRTGLPFLGDLSADETGAWLVYQGRLFHYVAAGLATPPTPSSVPSTNAPATSTTAPAPTESATTAPATTVPATTGAATTGSTTP